MACGVANKVAQTTEKIMFKQFFFQERRTLNFFFNLFLACALECWFCDSNTDPVCSVNWTSSLVTEQVKSNLYKECDGGNACFKSVIYDGKGECQSLPTSIEILFE